MENNQKNIFPSLPTFRPIPSSLPSYILAEAEESIAAEQLTAIQAQSYNDKGTE